MSLLVAKTVFQELVMACLLAAAPTIFSPSLVKATTDGVVLTPSAFSMTLGVLPSMRATQELVVPRSIPMMVPLPLENGQKLLIPRLMNLSISNYYSLNQNQFQHQSSQLRYQFLEQEIQQTLPEKVYFTLLILLIHQLTFIINPIILIRLTTMNQTKIWIQSFIKILNNKPPKFASFFDELVYGKAFDCIHQKIQSRIILYLNEDVPQILVAVVDGKQIYLNLRETSILAYSTQHQIDHNLPQDSYILIKQQKNQFILLYKPQMKEQRETLLQFFKFYLAEITKSPFQMESLLLYFFTVDQNKNMTLSASQIESLLKDQLKMKQNEYFQNIYNYIHKQQNFHSGEITFSQFEAIMKLMQCRLQFKQTFQKISLRKLKSLKNYTQRLLSIKNFINFLKIDQGETKQAATIAEQYFGKQQLLSFYDFSRFMVSNHTNIYDKSLQSNQQPQNFPLTSYHCYSSHNTYLTGDQFSSDSKALRYRHDLQNGYRCLEIDIHNGDKQPVVKHGFTFTSSITFQQVIKTIAKFSKENPKHTPIIISLQNHTNLEQQGRMVEILNQQFGNKILKIQQKINKEQYPTLLQTMGKIIIKGKGTLDDYESVYQSNSNNIIVEESQSQVADDQLPSQNYSIEDYSPSIKQYYQGFQNIKAALLKQKAKFDRSQKILSNFAGKEIKTNLFDQKPKINPLLLKLTAILGNGEWSKPSIWQSISLSQNQVEKKFKKSFDAVKSWTNHSWARSYPALTRLSSSNYNPMSSLELGIQMVAMNSQSLDHYTAAIGLFFRLGKSITPGYRLKRQKEISKEHSFNITPISCYMMSSLKDPKKIPEVQVKMQFLGCSQDMRKHSQNNMQPYTECIKDNAYNPIFKNAKTMLVKVTKMELAFILITVPDCGIAVVSLEGIKRGGYRSVALLDHSFQQRNSKIIFKIKID